MGDGAGGEVGGVSDLDQRFWTKVRRREDDACWLWIGCVRRTRGSPLYGRFHLSGKNGYAHRVAYEIAHGPVPEGLVVRHKCDNSLCCNPAHLEVGTQRENAMDCIERGRAHRARGSRHPRAVLTEATVKSIKVALALGTPRSELAKKHDVSFAAIAGIDKGGWAHV